jgi:hypothetical protein
MIYSPAHGDNAFTVPLMDQYLLRVMPAPADEDTKDERPAPPAARKV